jgi:tRNA(Ile2)-agmatinylcytidine synthase
LQQTNGRYTEREPMIQLHIGFDDTDSPRVGCTTYVAALLVEKLEGLGASFIDYPNLIRLNPNVPWKTRGNGALCLRIRCAKDSVATIEETVVETIEENADLAYTGTDPGVVFFFNHVPRQVRAFARAAIQGIVEREDALRLIRTFRAEAVGFKKGRGIIGGLAAIGEPLEVDHTYEIIAYRMAENRGTPRRLELRSVVEMDKKTTPLTFNNVDPETRRVLITPRGPDPILYGIRGESPDAVRRAREIVRSEELIERWVVFRTNQGTDAHLRRIRSIGKISPYNPVVTQGRVTKDPMVIPGAHVIFQIRDETGQVDCAAYEPTGTLKDVTRELIAGDFIEVSGGVRAPSPIHSATINVEKLRVLKLFPKVLLSNPVCPKCGKRMKSMGRAQGFRCKKCNCRSSALEKNAVREARNIKEALYITSPRSQRHLTKPLCRYGREKSGVSKEMIPNWHFP